MLGILCEKPSAARNFARALGGMKGSFNGEEYVIVAARGHLYEFADPSAQVERSLSGKYHTWSVHLLPWEDTDFSWKRTAKKDSKQLLEEIREALSKCDEIAIATDVDPTGEGELLAWEILDGLQLSPQKWSRFYFTDEAPRSIQNAFRTRTELKDMESDADYRKALYRSQWDFMSMQFTRIATCLTGMTLRQGRLKSAMVVLVGDGLKELNAYQKIPFYQYRFKDENGIVYICDDEPKLPQPGDLPKDKYTKSSVIVDSTEQKSAIPPRLPDLAQISGALAARGFRARTVLDTYQKMYEDQVVSYPRTEDKVISYEQFNELLPLADRIAAVLGVSSDLLTHRKPRPSHVKNGGAHGANRPGTNVPASLEELKRYGACAPAIYEMVAKAYLAMLCEDYIYTQQKGHPADYPDFKGVANQPVSLGFKAILGTDKDDDEEESGKLLGREAKPFIYEGFPPKPPVPTMKWLMKQLEKRNVGTGATRASTYAEVTSERSEDSLLKDTKGKITLTKAGEVSYAILPGTNIGSLEITEQVYADMQDIADGKKTGESLLPTIRELVVRDIELMQANMDRVKEAFPDLPIFAAAKEKLSLVYEPTGEEISFAKEWGGHTFTEEEIATLLSGNEIQFTAVSKAGKEYQAHGKLAKQRYKGKYFWGFKPEFDAIPESWSGHVFTEEERQILENGEPLPLTAVSARTKKEFSCILRLEKTKTGAKLVPEFEKKTGTAAGRKTGTAAGKKTGTAKKTETAATKTGTKKTGTKSGK